MMTDKKRTGSVDWEDLKFFLALARHRSLSATARALRVNHATVSRRVGALETSLGRVLFDRRAEGYALTAEGQALLDDVTPMEASVLAMLRRTDCVTELTGLVRLTTTRLFADTFLIHRLTDFHRAHPAIDLEVITESRLLSIARREADIALRFGPPKDSDLLARRVAAIGYGFFGIADWRDRVSQGETPPLVTFDDDDAPPEAAWLNEAYPGLRKAFRCNSWTAQAAAAKAGFGIGLLPRFLGQAAGLLPITMDRLPPNRDLWLLIRPDLANVPRVRAVVDHLVAILERDRAVLLGT